MSPRPLHMLFSAGFVALLLAGCLLSGCNDNEIRSYSAPKEARPVTSEPPSLSAAPRELVDWTLPEGWEQQPGQGMRYATLVVEAGEPPLEVRVTPLGMVARDALANVNRWREQIGLSHIGAGELDSVREIVQLGDRPADLIDMVGPANGDQPATQVLAAIVPGDQSVWFFLLMGPEERVSPHRATFRTFLESVRVTTTPTTASLPPDHPPLEGMPPGHPEVGSAPGTPGTESAAAPAEMTWDVPAGWQQMASNSAFRLVTFQVEDAGQSAEVAITKFPGGVGGVLANINRWRGQIGLDPVSTLDEQPMQRIDIDDNPAAYLDIVAPASTNTAAPRERMLVLMLPHRDMTYFIKMTGPNALLEEQKGGFDTFVRSIRFTGADS